MSMPAADEVWLTPEAARPWLRRLARPTGTLLVIVGLGFTGWGLLVWQWQDPFTALYTRYEQHQLAAAYKHRLAQFESAASPKRPRVAARVERGAIRREAQAYRLVSHEGQPLGWISVPRLGLKMVVVDGTAAGSLERGPGLDRRTFMPGEGRLVYIAGHRTTYAAPFAHIDSLRPGDRITLSFPYGVFVYAVTRHLIVPGDDLSVLRPGSTEVVALQACHPRFFATHRYIVYAKPLFVQPRNGARYSVSSAR